MVTYGDEWKMVVICCLLMIDEKMIFDCVFSFSWLFGGNFFYLAAKKSELLTLDVTFRTPRPTKTNNTITTHHQPAKENVHRWPTDRYTQDHSHECHQPTECRLQQPLRPLLPPHCHIVAPTGELYGHKGRWHCHKHDFASNNNHNYNITIFSTITVTTVTQ